MLRAPFFPGTSDIDQLSRIVTALGTPDEASWAGLTDLPDYIAFEPTTPPPLRELFTAADDATLDLLGQLLALCPTSRPTAEEALRHAYFEAAPPAAPPADLVPPWGAAAGAQKQTTGGKSG